MKRTQGSETSQYLEEEKSKEIPLVAASEGGRAQTDPNTKRKSAEVQECKRLLTFVLLHCGTFVLCVRVGVVGPHK